MTTNDQLPITNHHLRPTTEDIIEISDRQLNRAYLARQLLLQPSSLSTLEAIEYLVGMQAQAPLAPYVGLWTRLHQFDPSTLSEAIESREAVRIALMRSTIHLVSAADCLSLRPVMQAAITAGPGHSSWRRAAGADPEKLEAEARELLGGTPMTYVDLVRALERHRPVPDSGAMGYLVRSLLPLVQVPPRGLWGRAGPAAHTTAEHWLGRALSTETDPKPVIARYLRAYGPASLADIQAWSRLPRLAKAVEAMPELRRVRSETGRLLYDVPAGELPEAETAAPVRFLPEYDNVLLSHQDRRRVIARENRDRVFMRGALLVDGYVRGAWSVKPNPGRTLEIELFGQISPADYDEAADTGERLRQFLSTHRPVPKMRFIGP